MPVTINATRTPSRTWLAALLLAVAVVAAVAVWWPRGRSAEPGVVLLEQATAPLAPRAAMPAPALPSPQTKAAEPARAPTVTTSRLAVVGMRPSGAGRVATVVDLDGRKVFSLRVGDRVDGMPVVRVDDAGIHIDHGTYIERVPAVSAGALPASRSVVPQDGPYDDEDAGHHGM